MSLRDHIVIICKRTLANCDGNLSKAARALQITRNTLRKYLNK